MQGTISQMANFELQWWDWRTGVDLDYRGYANDPDHVLTVNDTGLTPEARAIERSVLSEISEVCGVRFCFVDGDAQLTIDDEDGPFAETIPNWDCDGFLISSTLNLPEWIGGGLGHDGYRYGWYHELAEMLGIGHAGYYYHADENGRVFDNDGYDWSSASGFGSATQTFALRRVDIYALQQLYGPSIDVDIPADPPVSVNWHVVADADFDGDGDQDILWRHCDGAMTIWELEDGAYVVNHNLPMVSENWHVEGTPDINNDGDADILWRHNEGDNTAWELEGLAYVVNHNGWLAL